MDLGSSRCPFENSGGGGFFRLCRGIKIFCEIQYGRQIPGLVIQTFFFTKEDKSKILLPSMGFSYPCSLKKYFCHPGVLKWGPKGLLAKLVNKKGLF